MSKWKTGRSHQVILGYPHIASPLEVIYDEQDRTIAYAVNKEDAVMICKAHNRNNRPLMGEQIETGMTVRTLVDSETSDHFPKGTICKVGQKGRAFEPPPLDVLFWVEKDFTRTDGSVICVSDPFYADELEIVTQ